MRSVDVVDIDLEPVKKKKYGAGMVWMGKRLTRPRDSERKSGSFEGSRKKQRQAIWSGSTR